MEQSKMLLLSNWIYNFLLHVYPAPFRREYGRHMAQVFRDDVRGTLRESGTTALIGLWLLTIFDLVKTAIVEHIWEVFHMPLEKMTRWSGPAAAIGGILYSLGVVWNFGIDKGANFTTLLAVLTFLVSGLLIGLGLYGLNKRLSAKSGLQNRPFFVLAFTGILIYNVSIILVFLLDIEWLVILGSVGWFLMQLGIGGMGFIALTTKSLGKWSFSPLLVVALGFLLTIIHFLNNFEINLTMMISLIMLALGWVVLGVSITQNQEDDAEPALFA